LINVRQAIAKEQPMKDDGPLEFDSLTLREEPVRIGSEHFILTEASAEATRQYRNRVFRAYQKDDFGGLADVEMLLVSLCLFRDSKHERPVQQTELIGWPGHIIKSLFIRIKMLSKGLDVSGKETPDELRADIAEKQARLRELEGDGPKNGTGATTDGSSWRESSSLTPSAAGQGGGPKDS
jgi:hypothetical protein